MENAILVDVSRWQPPGRVSYKTFAENGVIALIAKASQGDFYDLSFPAHMTGAEDAGLIGGAYHWFDPGKDANAQAQTFISRIKGFPVKFIAADIEQHWRSWAEWYNHNITLTYESQYINKVARYFVDKVCGETGLPTLIYTRKTWVQDWANQGYDAWMRNYFSWLAYYPYTRTRINCTWDDLYTKYWPKIEKPAEPTYTAGWLIWQFTGDKFVLPGYGGPLDVNMFNGSIDEFTRFCGGEIPQTTKPTFVVGGCAVTKTVLRVRSGPGITFTQLAKQSAGTTVEILDIREGSLTGDIWLKISPAGWIAAYYKGFYLAMPVENSGFDYDYVNYTVIVGKLKVRTAPTIKATQAKGADGKPLYYTKGQTVKCKADGKRVQEGPYLWAETAQGYYICIRESGDNYVI